MLAAARPDIVLLDTMGSPGESSLLETIRTTVPEARVVVYSGYVSILPPDRLGGEADGYLEKGDDEQALVAKIHAVAGIGRCQRAVAAKTPTARSSSSSVL